MLDTAFASMFDYSKLAQENIPLRLRLADIDQVVTISGNTDVVLILDKSGSMENKIGSSPKLATGRDCDDPLLFDNSTRRMAVMKCLAKNFTEKVLSISGNKVSVVGFDDNSGESKTVDLTDNKTKLFDKIENFEAGGTTCICCGINRGSFQFRDNSPQGRNRIAIVFTDGIPNHVCQPDDKPLPPPCPPPDESKSLCKFTAFSLTVPTCPKGTKTGNAHSCEPECKLYGKNGAAVENAIWSAGYIMNQTYNATVYSIGLALSDCAAAKYAVESMANVGGGKSFSVLDGYQWADAFDFILEEIIKLAFFDQTSIATGLNKTILYPDSNIKFDYSDSKLPNGTALSYRLNFTSPGSSKFEIPNGFGIMEANLISYSGAKWTKEARINNSVFDATFFNLSIYGSNYIRLGDPYRLHIPRTLIKENSNNVSVFVGNSPDEFIAGSVNNKFALTIAKPLSSYSRISIKNVGCNWDIQTIEGYINLRVPSNYTGTKLCIYNSTYPDYGSYDFDDAYDNAVLSLLQELDINKDNVLDIPLSADNIRIEALAVPGIPFTWHSIIEIRVWR
ncbi:VWA domain-containing protein [Candidatus Pacearchaeota archaeon]|nr:VWA domain-containing protein [Candidatus Pacearchaeota archaeon]